MTAGMYKEMYYHLFNAVTDAWQALEQSNYGTARDILKKAQTETEEMYLSADEGKDEA